MHELIIIGSGPAGLTAAIYAARANMKPLLFEGPTPGGQLIISNEVENYPGFPETISGAELMELFKAQAIKCGAEIISEEVESITKEGEVFTVKTNLNSYQSQAVIAGTGATARRLPIESEAKFYGRGVSGCATCDGAFFRNAHVLVIGGGNTAMEDATFLTRFADKVTIVHRRDYFRAAPTEVEKAKANPKIEWLIPYQIEEIKGDMTVSSALLRNTETQQTISVNCDGVFVAIGHDPQTSIYGDLVEYDQDGFIVSDPITTATLTPGLFACGDVGDPIYKQAVTAAGSGCKAALDVQKFLESK